MSLHLHYVEKLPEEDQIRCQKCKGIGDAGDDTCPYCGHDEGDPVVPETPVPPVAATPVQTEMTKPKEKKMNATTTETNAKPKKEKVHKAMVVDDTKPASALRAERDLDEAISKVDKAQGDAAISAWQLGRYIADIRDNGLWKLRTQRDEAGKEKSKWRTFEAFCAAELRMTPRNAHNLAEVSKNFTEDQVKAVGHSKLSILLLAPPEARPEIQKQAEAGASASEVRTQVKKARAESKEEPKKTRTSKATEAKQAKVKSEAKTLTIATLLGSSTIKLYRKPPSLKGLDLENTPRAKRLADEPFGVEEMENGVITYYTIAESATGELVLRIVRKREE
jgi:hypothetical protein